MNLLRALPGIALTAIIYFLSTADGQDLPSVDIVNFDKLAHAACYFVYTLSLVFIFDSDRRHSRKLICALWAILFGVAMEYLQDAFHASRHFDVYDIIANSLGAILALAVLPLLFKR